MSLHALLEKLDHYPLEVQFTDVIKVITEHYQYTPCRFSNGDVVSEAGTNEGSCKIFAFAQLHHLSPEKTLACFGKYYREDVLQHPEAVDHANIRQFMRTGWQGIQFDAFPLTPMVR